MKVKDDFHHLIDTIENEELLKGYYELIRQLNINQTADTWKTLTDEQRQEVLIAYEESFDEKNLISHEEVMKKLERWLKP